MSSIDRFVQRGLLSVRLLLVLVAASVFTGCPHHIENLVDKTLPPENYEPGYINSEISYDRLGLKLDSMTDSRRSAYLRRMTYLDSLLAASVENGVLPAASVAEADNAPGPIRFDIRSVDHSGYPDKVILQASVFDTTGTYVSGLAPPDFEGSGSYRDYWFALFDSCNGETHVVDEFEVEEITEETRLPYALSFVLDHSGSMGRQRVLWLRKAVALLLRGISPRDRVAIHSFTNSPFLEVPLTDDKREWVTRFDSSDISTYGGGTALYDAALSAIEEVSKGSGPHERVVILFTDGVDGNSDAEREDVHRRARELDVTLYTIAYGPADQETLRNLAHYSGGRMYRIYRSREFLDVFIDIYRRLNRYYRISYSPPECAGWHTARAMLSLPEYGIVGLSADGTYDRSIITPVDPVGKIVFVNIEFDVNEATIRPESIEKVREVADVMKRYPDMTLEVRGHTDDQGSEKYNQKLSERRAKAVADQLVDMGVSQLRLKVTGFGESRPLVPNDSEENRRKNRRTEFVILSK